MCGHHITLSAAILQYLSLVHWVLITSMGLWEDARGLHVAVVVGVRICGAAAAARVEACKQCRGA
jgi:hypothetical protein